MWQEITIWLIGIVVLFYIGKKERIAVVPVKDVEKKHIKPNTTNHPYTTKNNNLIYC